ncbi:MAG: helix-turn-helix transcriptional regulator [Actinobacteria bacterium]|nr:helix-turn-helix transcriptional regulator [Actinomycetota bacterium]
MTKATSRTPGPSRQAKAPPAEQGEQITLAQLDAAAATFDMLSVPGRLHLVWLLSSGEYDVTTLAELTNANVPAASQQLAKLRAAGLVSAVRDGRRQLYRVDDPHIIAVIRQMFSHIAPDGTLTPTAHPTNSTPLAGLASGRHHPERV